MMHIPIPCGKYIVGCVDILIGQNFDGALFRLFYPSDIKDLMFNKDKWTYWYLGDEYSKGITENLRIPAVWEATVAQGTFPLIVFSHGLSSNRSFYSILCTELASHGFYVAALEHRDGTACASFTINDKGEKNVIPYTVVPKEHRAYPVRNSQVKFRLDETTKVLNVLQDLNDGKGVNLLSSNFDLSQLRGCFDMSKVVIAGHSFGGITAICSLKRDSHFKIGVALDPWMFPMKDEFDFKDIAKPLLCISTEFFQCKENLDVMRQLNPSTSSFVTIKGTVHLNQCDAPFLTNAMEKWFINASSSLNYKTATRINNALMLSFICKELGSYLELVTDFEDVKLHAEHLVFGLHGSANAMLGLISPYLKNLDSILKFHKDVIYPGFIMQGFYIPNGKL